MQLHFLAVQQQLTVFRLRLMFGALLLCHKHSGLHSGEGWFKKHGGIAQELLGQTEVRFQFKNIQGQRRLIGKGHELHHGHILFQAHGQATVDFTLCKLETKVGNLKLQPLGQQFFR